MRVAVAQAPGVRLEQWRETLALVDDLIRQGAGLRTELVVLPECVWPAYCIGTRRAYDEARAAGLPGPATFLQHVQQTARERGIAVCIGHIAEQGDRLYNAASLIDAEGRLAGTCCKCFLWACDHDYFEPGGQIEPLDAAWGRTGVMICADARLPEIPATLAARGAELILHPTAWVNAGTPETPWNPQPDFLISARAREFGVPIASASKWGGEGETTFVGGSLICDAAGNVLVRCRSAETTVVAADIKPQFARAPVVTDAERAVLRLTGQQKSPRAKVGPLEVMLLPTSMAPPTIGTTLPASNARPRLIIRPDFAGTAARTPEYVGDHVAVIGGPMPQVVELHGVRIGAVAATDAARFAALRCLALRGVHVVVVFGAEAPLSILQARACENRVPLLQLDDRNWCAIAPTGRLLAWSATPGWEQPATVLLNPAEANSKLVAPQTDVLADRRPGHYGF